MSEVKFTEEDLAVSELTVDPKVQRTALNYGKVEPIMKNFNPNAVGRITVSVRDNGEKIILDGWHRNEAIRILTDNKGTIPARVFRGLSFEQEADMFLDLNTTNRPKAHDAWRVRVNKGEPLATSVTTILGAFGWTVDSQAGNGKFNAVAAVERIETLSRKIDAEPGLVHATILVITRAWGDNRHGVVGPIFEGIARFIAEYGKDSAFDLQSLIVKLRDYKGGPKLLNQKAQQMTSLRKMRAPMAVADLLTEMYNEGPRKKKLPPWRHRS